MTEENTKPRAKADAPERLSAARVDTLIAHLSKMPKDARVYGTVGGELAVWTSKSGHLAFIDLLGI